MLKFKRVAGGDDGREGLTLDLFIFGVCVRTTHVEVKRPH